MTIDDDCLKGGANVVALNGDHITRANRDSIGCFRFVSCHVHLLIQVNYG